MNNAFGLKCDFRFCEDFLFLSLILPALFCHSLQRNMVFDVIPFWMRWTIFQLIFRTKPNFVKRNCISQLDRHLLGSFFLLHSNFVQYLRLVTVFATFRLLESLNSSFYSMHLVRCEKVGPLCIQYKYSSYSRKSLQAIGMQNVECDIDLLWNLIWIIFFLHVPTPTLNASLSSPLHNQSPTHRAPRTKHRPSKCQRRTDRTTMLLVAVLLLFLITEFPQGILGLLSGLLEACFFERW